MPTTGFLNLIFHGPWGLAVVRELELPEAQSITAVTPQINGQDPHLYLIGDALLNEIPLPPGDFTFCGLKPVYPRTASDVLSWRQAPGHPRAIRIPSYASHPQTVHCGLRGLPLTQMYGLRAAKRIHAGLDVLLTGADEPQLSGDLFPLVLALRYAYDDPGELALLPEGGGPAAWQPAAANLSATSINLHIYAQSAGTVMPPPDSDDFSTMAGLFTLKLQMGGILADQRVGVDLIAGDFGLRPIDELALGERPLPPGIEGGSVGTAADPTDCGIPLVIYTEVGVETNG